MTNHLRRTVAIVGAAACALASAALATPAGAAERTGADYELVTDCAGDPISTWSTIYVPAGTQGWTYGTAGDDVIIATSDLDHIDGLGGNDTICAGGGDDHVVGGLGEDWIDGEAGDDTLEGNEAHDRIDGGRGDDTIDGGRAGDTVFGDEGEDHIDGGLGDDVLYGMDDDDIVHCGDNPDGDDEDFGMGNEGHDDEDGCETYWADEMPGPE